MRSGHQSLDAAQSSTYTVPHNPHQILQAGITLLDLKRRKQRLREVKEQAQGHKAKWSSRDSAGSLLLQSPPCPCYIRCCKVCELREVKATPVLSIAPDTVSNTAEFYPSHRPTLRWGGRVTHEREFQAAGTIRWGSSWKLPASRGQGLEMLSGAI